MRTDLYEKYLSDAYELCQPDVSEGQVQSGYLKNRTTGQSAKIVRGVPRFVEDDGYAENFGLQWLSFQLTQYDSFSTTNETANRLWSTTGWNPEELDGKNILEAGSGAGRFTELFLRAGANVFSFDLTRAVDANHQNNSKKGNLIIWQGNVYDIPFENRFDYVFCFGVLQHTPDPRKTLEALYSKVDAGGKLSVDSYIKVPWYRPSPFYHPKYIWRPITRHMQPELLLKIIRAYMPFYLPIDTAIKRIPKIGPAVSGMIPIPCWNYLNSGFDDAQRLEWAVMDTFDALGAYYDFPLSEREMEKMAQDVGIENAVVTRGGNGLVLNAQRSRPSSG